MAVTMPVAAVVAPPLSAGNYIELKQCIRRAGLLDQQPRYYAVKIAGTTCLAAAGLAVLLISRNPWLQLCNAVYLAFVLAQISFIGHDIGHHQVLHAGRACTVLQLVFGNLLVGVSSTWWMTKHNKHHSHPNRPDYDPDVMLPVVAFSAARARAMNRLQRLMVRYQHVLFPVLLLCEGVVLRVSSIQYLAAQRGRRWLLDLLLIALHLGVYGWVVFHQLGIYPGIAFVVVHQMAFGLYMGAVFAPNHKGMLVIEDGRAVDFLSEQVLTSRNVAPSPAIDFLYGGLNYQIEHHLFPSMPRNRLHDAQALVQSFCRAHAIPYHQTTLARSYCEIFAHLYTVSTAAHGQR